MIKYLFSDIDGTLYVNDDVSRQDIVSIRDFVKSGGVFSLATGRADLEIVHFAKETQLPYPSFRISANGSMVVDGELTIFNTNISYVAQSFIAEYLAKHVEELSTIEASKEDFIYFMTEPEAWVLSYKGEQYSVSEHILQQFMAEHFQLQKIFIEGTTNFIDMLVGHVGLHLSDEVEIFNDPTAVNLAPKGINKGTGIQHILRKYGIGPEEIAVIGDAANDIGMFEITPHSFAFTYSQPKVQKSATHVVKNVADAMRMINHINTVTK